MERQPMLPAVERFVAELRAACAEGLDGARRWGRCRDLLARLLADPLLKAHAEGWPAGGYDLDKPENLLFYVDPDYGFALNGLIKPPGGRAMIHDHGPAWTVYGVLAGSERIVRYEVTEGPGGARALGEASSVVCGPGEVDLVPPHAIHSEVAGEERTVAFIVRSQKTGTFTQLGFEDGPDGVPIPGPRQVPYELR